MCTGAEIVGLALSAGSQLMQMNSANDAAEKQQSILAANAKREEEEQKKKAALVTDFAKDTFDPTKRDQRYEDAATKQETSLIDQLKAAQGGDTGKVEGDVAGNLSSDYLQAKGAATSAATEDILKRARLMARAGAGGLMYNDESLKGGQLASDIAGINSNISSIRRTTDAQLAGVNNNGSLIGGIMAGVAPAVGGFVKKKGEWDAGMNAMFGKD